MGNAIDFHRSMASMSREQLFAVLRDRSDYVPDAVSAAIEELQRRGVDAFAISAAEDEGLESAPAAISRSKIELGLLQKLLWVLLPFLAVTPLATKRIRQYSDAGYHRKSLQIMELSFIGFNLYVFAAMALTAILR